MRKGHKGEVKLQIIIFKIAKIGLMQKTVDIHFKGACVDIKFECGGPISYTGKTSDGYAAHPFPIK
jgi:hypothetical protein